MKTMTRALISLTITMILMFSLPQNVYADYGFSPSTRSDYGFNGSNSSGHGFAGVSESTCATTILSNDAAIANSANSTACANEYRYYPPCPVYAPISNNGGPCTTSVFIGNAGPGNDYRHQGQWKGSQPPPPAFCNQCNATHHYGHFHYNAARR